jgi:hypothetical protein
MALMTKLHKEGFLISTPSQDYDDSYCIQYAKKFNAFIVTNDKFRDYIESLSGEVALTKKKSSKPSSPIKQTMDRQQIKAEQQWIKLHSVSYTFKHDEFLPNPDS